MLLTQDALIAQAVVDPADVRKQFDANAKQYTAAEERSAAHILIPVKPDAKDDEKAAAKKLADEVYAKAKANPAKFGDLAKEYSKDPGSAQQGGELGNFGRGAMVKPFEDAAFAAQDGRYPAAGAFGFRLAHHQGHRHATGAHAAFRRSEGADRVRFEEAEGGAEIRVVADQFQNLVYEQADNLNGVGKALDLKIERRRSSRARRCRRLALAIQSSCRRCYRPSRFRASATRKRWKWRQTR